MKNNSKNSRRKGFSKLFLISFLSTIMLTPLVLSVSCSYNESEITFVGDSSIKLEIGYETTTRSYNCKINSIQEASTNFKWELTYSPAASITVNNQGIITILSGLSEGNYQLILKATWLEQPTIYKTLPISLKIYSSDDKYPEYQDYTNFINARSFSIRFEGLKYYTFGTAWIFEIINSSETDSNPYDYYLATNCHVVYDPFNEANTQKQNYDLDLGFSTYSTDTQAFSDVTYLELKDEEWEILYAAEFLDVIPSPTPPQKYLADFAVLSVDFSNYVSQDGNLKERLDYLNDYSANITKNNQTIEFAPHTQPLNQNTYTMGYPHIPNTFLATLRVQKSTINSAKSCAHTSGGVENYQYKYPFDEITQHQLCIADQYFHGPDLLNNLSGGASGSLTINENYEVVGIYWGGWNSSAGEEYNQGSTQPLITRNSDGSIKYNLIELFHQSLIK